MSILSYFVDEEIKRFYPDVNRTISKRGKAILLYSQQFNQAIYIKQSKRNQILNKTFMRQYQERNIRDMRRLMIGEFGPKEGGRLFSKADKLDILIVNSPSKQIWRYLRMLNKLNGSMTYNIKTFHLVFDRQEKTEQQIAAIIFGALYRRMKCQYESSINKLKQKKKSDFNGKPFGNLKYDLDNMYNTCNKLESRYYKLLGEKRIYDIPKFPEELKLILHDLSKSIENESYKREEKKSIDFRDKTEGGMG